MTLENESIGSSLKIVIQREFIDNPWGGIKSAVLLNLLAYVFLVLFYSGDIAGSATTSIFDTNVFAIYTAFVVVTIGYGLGRDVGEIIHKFLTEDDSS